MPHRQITLEGSMDDKASMDRYIDRIVAEDQKSDWRMMVEKNF